MALLYKATLSPTKIELLQAWVPAQPWSGGAAAATLDVVGAYRFDDPEGEVGIETHLVRTAGGTILQVPVTYRAAALPGAEASLIGNTEHSVLGTRWVYDGCADPVSLQALATAILQGGSQADLEVMTDAGPRPWDATTQVSGSGSAGTEVPSLGAVVTTTEANSTVIRAEHFTLSVARQVDLLDEPGGTDHQTLRGTWPGRTDPALLALLQPR